MELPVSYLLACPPPAPETPLCAIALAKLFERAGGPPGVLNIITSSVEKSPQIGEEFTQNDIVKHLSFTGSTAVGRYLHAECAKTFKKTSMERMCNSSLVPLVSTDEIDSSRR